MLQSVGSQRVGHNLVTEQQQQGQVEAGRLNGMCEDTRRDSPDGSVVKEFACNPGDRVQSLGQEDSLEMENGNPFQYSCRENPMDGGAWWAAVYGAAQSRT